MAARRRAQGEILTIRVVAAVDFGTHGSGFAWCPVDSVNDAADRKIYSRGALRAALWAVGQKPGLYGMKDVLGL